MICQGLYHFKNDPIYVPLTTLLDYYDILVLVDVLVNYKLFIEKQILLISREMFVYFVIVL